MIPKECKRLAEVDFPIAVVSKHSAREKSIRHGHPSTLHLWWARRPLAACRAMLLALLLPDPCDPHCPEDFKTKARELLPRVQGKVGSNEKDLQKSLLKFIGDFSNWDFSSDQTYLEVGRGLVKAAHPEEIPLVVDPFAGGGSIPLEALRLGCETFASDLNPVACLILKVMLEDIPRHGPELAEELRRVGKEIKEAAEKELAEFYPPDPDGAKPIAYLWARTVRCEAPNCGAEIPLIRSFWLCKKPNRKRALRYQVKRQKVKGKSPELEFEIYEPEADKEVSGGTVTRARATCPCCNMVLPPERVRAQLSEQHGGADVVFDTKGNRTGGARMLAVVTLRHGEQGRHYRLATVQDYHAILKAQKRVAELSQRILPGDTNPIPDELTPVGGGSGAGRAFSFKKYGQECFGDLFSSRQKVSLLSIAMQLRHLDKERAAVLGLGKLVDLANANCRWEPNAECPRNVFAAGRVKPSWDFAEGVPISESSGSLIVCFENLVGGVASVGQLPQPASCQLAAAQNNSLPEESADVWFTDPPYYDAYPYADLSDVFYVWLKRGTSATVLHEKFSNSDNNLTPKEMEIVQDESRQFKGNPKDRDFFEEQMGVSFAKGREVLKKSGLGCVVFAHKTTEGWEALLSGMIQGGLVIAASWPIATEQAHRLRAKESAALGTSVHLVCRPRPGDAPVGDWGNVLRELPKRVGDWMERLQSEGIRGADLVFACIGPALEIFSRYSKVVDAEEREIPLGGDPEASEPHRRGFLSYVWEVVGRTALEQVLGTADLPTPRLRQAGAEALNSTAGLPAGTLVKAGALEEDARLTALFLWTLQSTNGNGAKVAKEESEDDEETDEEEESPKKKKQGYSLIFDVVRRFAQPLGIHLPEWEGRVIETEKGVVRLLSVKERGKQLFGEESISVAGFRIEEQARRDPQMKFDFAVRSEGAIAPDLPAGALAQAGIKGRRPRKKKELTAESSPKAGVTTTLDRIHAAMLLQASGQTNGLRALLKAEQDRGPDFIRLANALSALYPKQSEEKRLLDAMLLVIPR